jgi:hypothetical protein
MNLLLAFVEIGAWGQFGLAGAAFITLVILFWRLFNKIDKADKDSVNYEVMMKIREETLTEVNKRDEQILELTRNTLKALNKSSNAIDKVADRLDELTSYLEYKDEEK